MTKNMTPNPMQPRRVFGADDDAPYFVGRKLYWTEVKEAAPGFLPDGLIVQTYNGRYVVQGGVLMKYQWNSNYADRHKKRFKAQGACIDT